jgi:hypothetical protein
MKSYRKELWFNAPARMHFTNITPDVRECLAESGIKEGLILVNAMHITASVFINDDDTFYFLRYNKFQNRMYLISKLKVEISWFRPIYHKGFKYKDCFVYA